MSGKVVVNRSMSLDGFIAGPGDAMDWIFDFVTPDAAWLAEIAAATGAMLVGRRTDEVGDRMDANNERGAASSDEGYPFSGPTFVLTHEPPDPPAPGVTYLTGDIGEAVATALDAAGGRTSKSSVPTWPVSACSWGSWTRSWCMSCRCCSGTASGSTPPRASRG
jgi:dihydrofolate reductase